MHLLPTYTLYQFLKRRHRHGTRARICPYCYFFLAICVTKSVPVCVPKRRMRTTCFQDFQRETPGVFFVGMWCVMFDPVRSMFVPKFCFNSMRVDKPQRTTKNCSVVYVWAANFRERVFWRAARESVKQ